MTAWYENVQINQSINQSIECKPYRSSSRYATMYSAMSISSVSMHFSKFTLTISMSKPSGRGLKGSLANSAEGLVGMEFFSRLMRAPSNSSVTASAMGCVEFPSDTPVDFSEIKFRNTVPRKMKREKRATTNHVEF